VGDGGSHFVEWLFGIDDEEPLRISASDLEETQAELLMKFKLLGGFTLTVGNADEADNDFGRHVQEDG
jgi:hypothetical protein